MAERDGHRGVDGQAGKVDRRIVRTRRALMDAFERLLAVKPMGDITVSALAQEAGVDRKTFYQHFGTFDGLLDAIAQEYVDRVLADADAAVAQLGPSTLDDVTNAFFASVNQHVLRDVVVERQYFENLSTEKLLSHLHGPLTRGIMGRDAITCGLTPLQVQASITFLLGGMLAVYRSWLLSDQDTPLDEVAALVNDLVQNGLRRTAGQGAGEPCPQGGRQPTGGAREMDTEARPGEPAQPADGARRSGTGVGVSGTVVAS